MIYRNDEQAVLHNSELYKYCIMFKYNYKGVSLYIDM